MMVRKTVVHTDVITTAGLCAGMFASKVALVLVTGLPIKWYGNPAVPTFFSAQHFIYIQASASLGLVLLARMIVLCVKRKLDFHA